MKQILIAIDQFVNTLVWASGEGFGMADETISARLYRLGALEGRKHWRAGLLFVDAVFFWDYDEAGRGHCEQSWKSEFERHQLPSSYRGEN